MSQELKLISWNVNGIRAGVFTSIKSKETPSLLWRP
jgi:exonuclease III